LYSRGKKQIRGGRVSFCRLRERVQKCRQVLLPTEKNELDPAKNEFHRNSRTKKSVVQEDLSQRTTKRGKQLEGGRLGNWDEANGGKSARE